MIRHPISGHIQGGHIARSREALPPREHNNTYCHQRSRIGAIAYNESHVCDVALSPTRAKGHVAERRAAAPRSPSRPEGAAMYIRAVMRSYALTVSPIPPYEDERLPSCFFFCSVFDRRTGNE